MSVEKDFLRSMVLLMAATHQQASFARMEALMNDRAAIHSMIADEEHIDAGIRYDIEEWFQLFERKENDDLWQNILELIRFYQMNPRGILMGQKFWFTMEPIFDGPQVSSGMELSGRTCPYCGRTQLQEMSISH